MRTLLLILLISGAILGRLSGAPSACPERLGEVVVSTPVYELTLAVTGDGRIGTTLRPPIRGDFVVRVETPDEDGARAGPVTADGTAQDPR